MKRKPAGRTNAWKKNMRDKQIKPRREDEKDSVNPQEKKSPTTLEKARKRMLFQRYGITS